MNRTTLRQKLGQRIACERKKVGMTQASVAEALGIGNEAVSRLERGLVDTPVSRLMQFAELFGCTTQDFFLEQSTLMQDQTTEIQALLNRANPAGRRFAIEQLRRFIEFQENQTGQ